MSLKIIVTGGAGFIGSNLVNFLVKQEGHTVLTIDLLTYAGNMLNLQAVMHDARHKFSQQDVTNLPMMRTLVNEFQPDVVFHLAAESHVDRSIDNAKNFVSTNYVGTHVLAEVLLTYWRNLSPIKRESFKFINLSTDEVFGSVQGEQRFNEETPYHPNSPYAATKAGADLLLRSYQCTYGLPIIIVNCTNNYGPLQHPEKLIPLMIIHALREQPLPVYGDGLQIRDWIFVYDHIKALTTVLYKGKIGETYCIGSENETTNIELIKKICAILDSLQPGTTKYSELITHVTDRPGHDRHYAIDPSKIYQLGWQPEYSLDEGLALTIKWYLDNSDWVSSVIASSPVNTRLGLQSYN